MPRPRGGPCSSHWTGPAIARISDQLPPASPLGRSKARSGVNDRAAKSMARRGSCAIVVHALRRGGARRSSTIFAATMFPRLAAFTTDRTTPSTSDASNCSAKMVLLCRAPLGGPELPFANGSTARFGGVVSLVHAGDSKIDDSRSQWKNVTSASPRDDDRSRLRRQLLVETRDLAVALIPIHSIHISGSLAWFIVRCTRARKKTRQKWRVRRGREEVLSIDHES